MRIPHHQEGYKVGLINFVYPNSQPVANSQPVECFNLLSKSPIIRQLLQIFVC